MRLYAEVTGKKVSFDDVGPDGQKDSEIAFVLIEMAATGLVAYKLDK